MRKVFKSGKKIFKFSVILFFIAVFGFSNLGPAVLDYFGADKLAQNFEIKTAQAAVANDAASESHTGTTGSVSTASFTWVHTPVSTPRGVLVFVYTISATKKVVNVTYGGVAMTEILGGAAVDTAIEPGRIDTFFLGAGIPAGAQSIVVNRINDATIMYASAATQIAGANTEIYIPGIILLQENGTFVEQLIDDGLPGTNSQRYAAAYSGGANILSAGAASTILNNIDFGVYTVTTAKETTAGQGARNVGFIDATADDRAAVHLAVREIPPPTILTISQTVGSKITNLNSGDVDQYAHDVSCTSTATCAAFTLIASSGAVNVTSIKVTESGTATANTELSDVNLYYDTDGNWSDVGAETLFGTAATLAADQTATISGTLAISAGATAYIYVRYDLANGTTYPIGGATVNWQIAAFGDVVSDGTESGSGTLAGTQTVLPFADSVTYAVSPDGGRTGNSATISGKGFGEPSLDADQQDCVTATVGSKGCVRFIVGGAYTVQGIDISTWNNTTITFVATSSITTFGGASALEVVAAAQLTATDLTYYIYPNITSISGTPVADGQREASNVDLNGTRFDVVGNQGTVNFVGNFGTVAATIVLWSDTLVTVTVPTAIADDVYLGDIKLTRAAATASKDDLAYGGNTFRILPRIISTTPINLKGGRGDTVAIAGDHLCQSGAASCPTVFDVNNKVSFTGGDVTSGASAWTNTSIPSIVIPATATDGNLNITSRDTVGAINYVSNNLTYNIKFAPTTPTNTSPSGSGISKNPTLLASAFSDGTDGDSHSDSMWQITKLSGDYAAGNKVWEDTLSTASTTIDVNSTNGTFTNTTLTTELNCGTTYYWHARYKDSGGVTSQEWSVYSTEMSFTTVSCNASPTISISQPPAGNINVNQGDSYNITYTLNDSDNIVVANFYYDTNATGLDGTAITGCQNQAEGTNLTCAWNTTSYPLGTYYVYGTSTDGINPQVNAYSVGTITIQAPPQVTASSAGTQTVNLDSGATNQYIGAAFTFQQNNGTADTITALTISETGTASASSTLSANAGVRYETGVASCTYNGTETLISGTFNASDKMVLSGTSIPVTVGSNYTCVYVVFDIASSTVGGQTIDLEINSSADFTLSGGTTKSGTYPVQLTGTTTVRPNVTNPTDSPLGDGGRNGETFTITGTGFGTACGSISVQVGTLTLACNSANNTTISATVSSTQTTTFGGIGASGLLVTVGGTADDTRQTYYIYPDITSITGTPVADGQREESNIDINGKRFDSNANQGTIVFTGGFGSVSATIVSWSDTLITITVPTAISDSVYLGDITLTRAAVTGSKTDTAYGGNTFRILPRIVSTNPTSPIKGENVIIIGNHLCQAGAAICPTVFNASNKITFYNGVDATVFSGWSNTSATTTVPITAQSPGNIVIRSNDYNSNNFNVTIFGAAPNTSTNLEQKTTAGVTIAVAGGASSTSIIIEGDLSATTTKTMVLEAEVKAIGAVFDGLTNLTTSTPNCVGTSCVNQQITISGLSNGTQYHWRARAKNVTTSDASDWAVFGGNTDPNDVDFYVDTQAPTITPSACPYHSNVTDISATISWTVSDFNSSIINEIRYGIDSTLTTYSTSSVTSGTSASASLSGLAASTNYYYQVRSTDAVSNIASNPANSPYCQFTTLSPKTRLMKTLEFYIEQATSTTGSFDKNFDVFISEKSGTTNIIFKSIIIEVFGLSKNTGNFYVDVTLNDILKTYTIADTGSNATYWNIVYNASNINYDYPGDTSANNTLNVSSGASTNTLLGAKAIVTYYYELL